MLSNTLPQNSLDTPSEGCNTGSPRQRRVRLNPHIWSVRQLIGSVLKQISVFDFYVLGRSIAPLRTWKRETLFDVAAPYAGDAYDQLREAVSTGSFLLPATIDAAKALTAVLVDTFGESLEAGFWMGSESVTLSFRAAQIERAARDFELVFRLDSPRMAILAVPKKGIYQTTDLIEQAELHLPASLARLLPEQAKTDIAASGKCLALDVSTASAFHMWRALETVFGSYYVALTAKTFEQAKVNRNWFKYIEALTAAGVDTKITGNLDHIREHYRNPCMHPNENVAEEEAFSLFGIGISAITQVLQAMAARTTAL